MDPNRHSLETLLKLPTKRLLNYFKKIRLNTYLRDWDIEDWELEKISPEVKYKKFSLDWYRQQQLLHNNMIAEIKKELDTREHIWN
jgi:hypothetical protein